MKAKSKTKRPAKRKATVAPPPRLTTLGENRVIQPYPLREVTIIGMGMTAQSYVQQCALEGYGRVKGEKEVWALNAAAYAFDCDLAWSVHDGKTMQNIWNEYTELQQKVSNVNLNWMKDLKVPVVLGEALKSIKNSLEVPLHEMYADYQDPYFNNTTPFAVAFAGMCFKLWKGKEKRVLNLYGTDFNYYGLDGKSEEGRPCMEYWLGRMIERGVEVNIPPQSMLMETNLRRARGIYGYGIQPVAKRDEAGLVVGIEEFVDPIDYRLDSNVAEQLQKKLGPALKDHEDETINRRQALGTAKLICQALDISQIELFGMLNDKLELQAKDGTPSSVSF